MWTDFDQKVNKVISIIFSLAGAPAPMEIERKFLIKKPDFGRKELKEATKSNIVQTYLRRKDSDNGEDNTERRIRQRISAKNGYNFTYTEKTPISGLKRIERERILSMREYVNLMSEADTNLHQICKDRYCFLYEGQYFELDIYAPNQELPFDSGCAILEIELPDENAEVKIPDFIDVIKEVTDDERFKNHSIASLISSNTKKGVD